ncbi:MAG: hypothetical protein ACLQQ4_18380 [Bacteroidia bacterium]
MLLIAFTIGLLVIVAGMKLLAQTQKENLGILYKYVSWFVVIMGFLSLICVGMHCIVNHCRNAEKCRMENRYGMDDGGYYNMHGCNDMMRCNHRMGGGNCMMMHGGCDGGMGNGSCDNMCNGGGCKDGQSCGSMGPNCRMNDGGNCNSMDCGNCPMKGGECPMTKNCPKCHKKDSLEKK